MADRATNLTQIQQILAEVVDFFDDSNDFLRWPSGYGTICHPGAGASQEDRRFSRRTGLFLTQIQQILAEVDGFNVKRKRKDVLFILRCTSTWCRKCVKSPARSNVREKIHRSTGDLAGAQ